MFIDRQSLKTTESGGICGFDAGKKIKGRKRHIVTDMLRLLGGLVIHAGGYAGPKLEWPAVDRIGDTG